MFVKIKGVEDAGKSSVLGTTAAMQQNRIEPKQ